jgi:hypothetical protein
MPFSEFVKNYSTGAALLFASVAVSYFLTYHTSLTPPLKPTAAIFGMGVPVEAYGVLAGLNAKPTRRAPLYLMIGCIVVYLTSLFSLTFLIPTSATSYRDAMGFVCKKQFLDLYGPACYWIEPTTLEKNSFEPERIWEFWSIGLVRGFLCTIWLLMIWSIVTSIAISIRRYRRRTKRRSQKSDKAAIT